MAVCVCELENGGVPWEMGVPESGLWKKLSPQMETLSLGILSLISPEMAILEYRPSGTASHPLLQVSKVGKASPAAQGGPVPGP